MIGTSIDRAAAGSPGFEKRFRNRIDSIYRTGFAGEAAVFLAASAAAGISASFGNDFMFIFSLVITAAVWIQTALTAGFLKEWLYTVFVLIYFWLPGVFIIPADNISSQAGYGMEFLLNDISRQLWASPVLRLMPEADITTAMLIAAAAEMAVFFIGSRIRAAMRHSSLYCKIRLEQLGEQK